MRARIVRHALVVSLAFGSVPAAALPRALVNHGASAVLLAENRFLPRFFGGRDDANGDRAEADAMLRMQQLEEQVRTLTGQVEALTNRVSRLEQALASAQQAPNAGTPGPGAPPRPLGQLPAERADAATGRIPATGGPLDLSALNLNPDAPAARAPAATASTPAPTAPEANAELAHVRQLHGSGRYAMAVDAARAVLTDNPTGPVATEARFLLGEALLAQRDYSNAARQFMQNYTSDPESPRAPESLLRLSTALNGLGEKEAACSSLEELLGAYPDVSPELRAAARAEQQVAGCV